MQFHLYRQARPAAEESDLLSLPSQRSSGRPSASVKGTAREHNGTERTQSAERRLRPSVCNTSSACGGVGSISCAGMAATCARRPPLARHQIVHCFSAAFNFTLCCPVRMQPVGDLITQFYSQRRTQEFAHRGTRIHA